MKPSRFSVSLRDPLVPCVWRLIPVTFHSLPSCLIYMGVSRGVGGAVMQLIVSIARDSRVAL